MITALIKKLDQQLADHRQYLVYLEDINPLNTQEEETVFWERFKIGQIYQPQFLYHIEDKHHEPLQKILRNLDQCEQKLSQIDSPYQALFQREIETQRAIIHFINAIGSPGQLITEAAINLFGGIDQRLKLQAASLLKPMPADFLAQPQSQKIRPPVIRQKVAQALHDIGAHDWKFDFQPHEGITAVVRPTTKTVYFPRQAVYESLFIDILIHHEIYGHVAHNLQSETQSLRTLQQGLGVYEGVMEGIALHAEKKVNPLVSSRIAFYYVAVDKALTASFAEVFEYLSQWLHSHDAYQLAVRTKRGLTDTAQAGSWMKDKIYWEGWCTLELLSASDQRVVRHGKFPVDCLAIVKKITNKTCVN